MKKYLKSAFCVGALVAAGSAGAATATGNLTVSATVVANCLINSATMPFGNYTPGGGDLDASGTIVMRCANNQAYAVGLGAGLAAGATETNRSMQQGAVLLSYQLFKDTLRTQNWGQTLAADRLGGTGTGLGNTQTLTIYGRVPDSVANQNVSAVGAFADTVLVTITY